MSFVVTAVATANQMEMEAQYEDLDISTSNLKVLPLSSSIWWDQIFFGGEKTDIKISNA